MKQALIQFKKTLLKAIFLFAIFSLLLPSPVSADLIEIGTKYVN